MDNKELGVIGEDAAVRMLSCEGYKIIARNYRCKYGEIDVIAQRDNCLHFIEVKTRSGYDYGRPCEAVTPSKQAHIRKTAVFYLKQLKRHGCVLPRIQFQIIEIVIDRLENAF